MIEAMAQSRRNFCRRNCVHATERGGCTAGARPQRVGPQFPRRGGAYLVERLQGFPDDWTKIDESTPDTPRYKALGNSMAVPVMRWIGERIQMVDEILGGDDVQVHG